MNLEQFNTTFYSNKNVDKASSMPLWLSAVLFIMIILLMGLSASFKQNQVLQDYYANNQIAIDEQIAQAFSSGDNCLIDQQYTFTCQSYEQNTNDLAIYDQNMIPETGNYVALLDKFMIVKFDEMLLEGPYTFSYEFSNNYETNFQIASLAMYGLMTNYYSNTMLDELVFGLLLVTINILLTTSVTSYIGKKQYGRQFSRLQQFKKFTVMAIAPSVIGAISTILLPISFSGWLMFALLYNVRIYFYVKVFMK